MSDIFFEQMDIPRPNHFLGVSGLAHGAMTGRMLEGIEEVILKEKPDWVLVYGDTNSTLAGALAASKLHVPVAHVEAGLRSHNLAMPEEVNTYFIRSDIIHLVLSYDHGCRKFGTRRLSVCSPERGQARDSKCGRRYVRRHIVLPRKSTSRL